MTAIESLFYDTADRIRTIYHRFPEGIDPAFDTEGNGTSADDHPLADVRLGERFIADAYHALANAGYLDNTVFMVTFDEWGGFYDHVPPPHAVSAAPRLVCPEDDPLLQTKNCGEPVFMKTLAGA